MTLTGLGLGIVFSLFVPVNDLASQFLPGVVSLPVSSDISSRLLSLADSLLGAIVGASFIYGAGAIYLRARGIEGMGFGDVKLMAMIGAFLGVKLTVFTIFTASIAGSVFGVSTILMVWIKRTRRFVRRQHISLQRSAPARLAVRANDVPPLRDALRSFPGQHGDGRVLLRQPVSRLVLEAAVKLLTNPIFLKMVLVLFASGFAFMMAWLHDAPHPQEPGRRMPCRAIAATACAASAAHLPRGDSATEAAETRTVHSCATPRSRARPQFGKHQRCGAVEPLQWRVVLWPERTGAPGESGRQEHSRDRFAHRHERGRTLSPDAFVGALRQRRPLADKICCCHDAKAGPCSGLEVEHLHSRRANAAFLK